MNPNYIKAMENVVRDSTALSSAAMALVQSYQTLLAMNPVALVPGPSNVPQVILPTPTPVLEPTPVPAPRPASPRQTSQRRPASTRTVPVGSSIDPARLKQGLAVMVAGDPEGSAVYEFYRLARGTNGVECFIRLGETQRKVKVADLRLPSEVKAAPVAEPAPVTITETIDHEPVASALRDVSVDPAPEPILLPTTQAKPEHLQRRLYNALVELKPSKAQPANVEKLSERLGVKALDVYTQLFALTSAGIALSDAHANVIGVQEGVTILPGDAPVATQAKPNRKARVAEKAASTLAAIEGAPD